MSVGADWVLADSRKLRLAAFFLFYFGQGIPVGISEVPIPIWVAANGGTDVQVALLVGAAYLPWSFKFIPAALMDRYAFLAMGRHRAWLIGAQFLMMGGFLLAAFAVPAATDVGLLIYNSLANLPVTLGTMIFAGLGGMAAIGAQFWTMIGLAAFAGCVFWRLRVGNRHVAAEPVPEMN